MSATRISQLVKELEQIRHRHGDIEVWVHWSDPNDPKRMCYGERITSVSVSPSTITAAPHDPPFCVIHAEPA